MQSKIRLTPMTTIPIAIKGILLIENPINKKMPPIPPSMSPIMSRKLEVFCCLCLFSSFVSGVNVVDFDDLVFVNGGISLNFVPHERQKS